MMLKSNVDKSKLLMVGKEERANIAVKANWEVMEEAVKFNMWEL